MAARRRGATEGEPHRFGGTWTDTKLAVIERYLRSYTIALKSQPSKERPFRKGYIDAFAGSGYREVTPRKRAADRQIPPPWMADLAADEPQALRDGSASIALKVEPPFDKYIFIERNRKRRTALELLRDEFPARNIEILPGDANVEIRKLCKKNWASNRAVLFLDPYGMQVEWQTIVAIAETKAIDMWLLFPLGIGINRLLKRSGDIPLPWQKSISKLLGTEDWYDAFYRVETQETLFGPEERLVKARLETIGRYFVERLKTVFCAVAEEPKVLRNSSNNPLYLLCFAANNPKGASIALRIANHLLKDAD